MFSRISELVVCRKTECFREWHRRIRKIVTHTHTYTHVRTPNSQQVYCVSIAQTAIQLDNEVYDRRYFVSYLNEFKNDSMMRSYANIRVAPNCYEEKKTFSL